MRGYSYDRRDVTGRGLANAYAQTLGAIFSSGGEKPYEVELFVAEVADRAEDDQIYRLTYDGSVADEQGTPPWAARPTRSASTSRCTTPKAWTSTRRCSSRSPPSGTTTPRRGTFPGDRLEVAVLDRTRSRPRKFRRLGEGTLVALFGSSEETGGQPVETTADDAPPERYDGCESDAADPVPHQGLAVARGIG